MKYEMVRFGDYFELRKGFSYSGQNLAEESDIGFVTLNSFIPGGGYKANSEKPLVGEIPEKFFLHDGDVCLAMTEQDKGLLASGLVVDYESNDYSSLVYSHHVAKLFPLKNGLEAKFVYNVLRIPAFRVRASYGDAGSTVQDLPYAAMYEQALPCPPLNVQKAISNIIFDLDAKIRVNQQIASTLEQIARTIFKSWFVDFDPVHTKAGGELPVGMDAHTAALFPDSFEDSELGPIPSGWAFGTVSEIVDRQRPGKLFDKKTSSDEGQIPVLDQGASGLIGYHDEEPGVNASPDNPYVVFANHTCSLRIVSYPFSVIQNVFPIHGKNVSTIWLYFALQGKQEFDSYKGHWPDLVIKPVVIPGEQVTDAFAFLVEPLMKEAWILEHQNQTLGILRDSLLPRLISGELEIPSELLEA